MCTSVRPLSPPGKPVLRKRKSKSKSKPHPRDPSPRLSIAGAIGIRKWENRLVICSIRCTNGRNAYSSTIVYGWKTHLLTQRRRYRGKILSHSDGRGGLGGPDQYKIHIGLRKNERKLMGEYWKIMWNIVKLVAEMLSKGWIILLGKQQNLTNIMKISWGKRNGYE